MTTKWHLRVRAVIYDDGKFLIVRTKDKSHSYLIGGHVEEGESVPVALVREVMEEAGKKCNVKEYLGTIENKWQDGDVQQWEITHFFNIDLPGVKSDVNILPAEEGYDFLWAAPSEFESINLLPIPLRKLMKEWAEDNKETWWASTM